MKIKSSPRVAQLLVSVALAAFGSSAFAVATDWDLNALCASNATTSLVNSGANNCGSTLTLNGVSTGSGTGATTASAGSNFAAAALYDWGANGIGVVASNESSGATGPHAADNMYGVDAFQFKFSTAVNLTGLSIGWNGTDNSSETSGAYSDSDLSVFAWVGGSTPAYSSSSTALVMATASTAGWALIGNFMDVGASNGVGTGASTFGGGKTFVANNTNANNNDGTKLYSSYWLISAYSSAYGGTADAGVDAFKLLTVAGDTCTLTVGNNNKCGGTTNKAPEPGSIALVGIGAMGLLATRRQKFKLRKA